VKFRIVLFLLAVLVIRVSFACSCFESPGFEQSIKSHDRIIIVELKQTRNFLFQKRFKVKVAEVIKGGPITRLKSLKQGKTSCDPRLLDGQRWIVFLNSAEEQFQPGWCNPHQVVESLEHGTPNWRELVDEGIRSG